MPSTRRHFLRSSTTLIALPFLNSLGFRKFASATPIATPKRLLFLGMGYGVTEESWFPDMKQKGADYLLPPGLAPLAAHKSDFTIVQGLTNKFVSEAHWGSTYWLTGANRFEGGASFHNSVSADQVAAAVLGRETRFASLQLNGSEPDLAGQGHGPGLSMAWDVRGKPVAGLNNPVAVYHRLFSPDNTPVEQRKALLEQKRSVLDTVMVEANDLKRGLSKNDGSKLEEYLQSIRDIETALTKDDQWANIPKKLAPLGEPPANVNGRDEIKVMYDLIIAALQTDSTRVITYRQPVAHLLTSLGIKVAPHDMSHYSPGERKEASERRDVAQSELLAGFLEKLKTTKEADGSRLFDNTCLVYGSNIRSIHYLDNCPTILAGGAAGIKLGQNLVTAKDTPLCNAWLTLLRGLGVNVERHGDSSGVIKELMA